MVLSFTGQLVVSPMDRLEVAFLSVILFRSRMERNPQRRSIR
jgi:hypothetical protein